MINILRSKLTDRIRSEFNGIHRIMEAIFRPECLRIFPVTSGRFPTGKGWKLAGNHRKRLEVSRKSPEKSEDTPAGILFS
jgi:hypothetical protein